MTDRACGKHIEGGCTQPSCGVWRIHIRCWRLVRGATSLSLCPLVMMQSTILSVLPPHGGESTDSRRRTETFRTTRWCGWCSGKWSTSWGSSCCASARLGWCFRCGHRTLARRSSASTRPGPKTRSKGSRTLRRNGPSSRARGRSSCSWGPSASSRPSATCSPSWAFPRRASARGRAGWLSLLVPSSPPYASPSSPSQSCGLALGRGRRLCC
mmetsp:Transcript_17458/g.40294  ORF Transcript_17458/g.40294 Transcript_17458/m.40294 type:complete len:212 (+) Transcript_17458:51-686(+)